VAFPFHTMAFVLLSNKQPNDIPSIKLLRHLRIKGKTDCNNLICMSCMHIPDRREK